MPRNLSGCLAGAVAVVGLAACTPPAPDVEVEFRIPVEVTEVTSGTIEDLVVATGTLRPREIVSLAIETPGHLQIGLDDAGRRLQEGSTVSPGQVVFRVTGEDARLHAGLESTQRALVLAQAQLARQRELYDAQLVAEESVQQAERDYERALYEYERSALNAAKATKTTPIGGTILRLARDANGNPVADGQLVAAGFQVAEIGPVDELIAEVDLMGPELARVQPGLRTRIHHYAFPNAELTGEVIRLSPTLDPVKHTFRAEVAVANDAGLLRPGMFVEVSVVVQQRVEAAVVPRTAVTDRAGRDVVFLLDGQRVSRRDVSLGLGDDDQIEVQAGVTLGDRVVVRGLETLTDGARVRVIGT